MCRHAQVRAPSNLRHAVQTPALVATMPAPVHAAPRSEAPLGGAASAPLACPQHTQRSAGSTCCTRPALTAFALSPQHLELAQPLL